MPDGRRRRSTVLLHLTIAMSIMPIRPGRGRHGRCKCVMPRLAFASINVFLDIDDGRHSSYFTFHPHETYDDPVLRIKFHMCSPACGYGDFHVPFFHRRCFEFTLNLITPNFLAATEYNFQPPSYDSRRRHDLIRSLLLPKLPVRLPHEILAMVAEFLVHECAVVTAQEQMLQDASPSESLVDLTRNVYAEYHKFDGVYYIKSLRNSGSKKGKNKLLLLDVQKKGTVCKVFVAEDHLGIRSVQFAPSNTTSMPRPIPGAWWKDISRPGGITKIRVKTDVSRTTAYF